MAEIVTCVLCGQCVHNPENSRVCAECKATDLEDENREEIESALAYLDALTAIELSADANAGGCYSPELLERWGAVGEDSHERRHGGDVLQASPGRVDLPAGDSIGSQLKEGHRSTMEAIASWCLGFR